jgi:hypothetical protein
MFENDFQAGYSGGGISLSVQHLWMAGVQEISKYVPGMW